MEDDGLPAPATRARASGARPTCRHRAARRCRSAPPSTTSTAAASSPALDWTLGAHQINGGIWYEDNDFNQARRFYGEPNAAAPTRDFTEVPAQSVADAVGIRLQHRDAAVPPAGHVAGQRCLRVNFGFKSVKVENDRPARSSATVKTGTIEADEGLPAAGRLQLGAVRPDTSCSAAYAKNVRAFVSAGTAGPFSTTAGRLRRDPRLARAGDRRRPSKLGWRFRERRLRGRAGRLPRGLRGSPAGDPAGSRHRRQPVRAGQRRQRGARTGIEAGAQLAPDCRTSPGSTRCPATTRSTTTTITQQHGVPSCRSPASRWSTRRRSCSSPSSPTTTGSFFAQARAQLHRRALLHLPERGQRRRATRCSTPSVGYRFGERRAWLEGADAAGSTSPTSPTRTTSRPSARTASRNSDPTGTSQTLLLGAPRQCLRDAEGAVLSD